jgi:hypothetical protein
VARWRRPGAHEILQVFLLLAAIGSVCSWLSHSQDQNNPLSSFLVSAFLTWRVSRGGRISRMLLILGSGASYTAAALDVARLWNASVVALLIVGVAQVALLVSEPVYWHTRATPVTVRVEGWAPFAGRPPTWLLPWGLLAGVLVTLACLGDMNYSPIPGCQATASDTCSALARGYPLHWLIADQNYPLIFSGALLKDCVQWALVSMSVLYLGWSWAASYSASSSLETNAPFGGGLASYRAGAGSGRVRQR